MSITYHDIPIIYEDNHILVVVKPFKFKHTGLFPEQAVNWDWFGGLIRDARSQRGNLEDRRPDPPPGAPVQPAFVG